MQWLDDGWQAVLPSEAASMQMVLPKPASAPKLLPNDTLQQLTTSLQYKECNDAGKNVLSLGALLAVTVPATIFVLLAFGVCAMSHHMVSALDCMCLIGLLAAAAVTECRCSTSCRA